MHTISQNNIASCQPALTKYFHGSDTAYAIRNCTMQYSNDTEIRKSTQKKNYKGKKERYKAVYSDYAIFFDFRGVSSVPNILSQKRLVTPNPFS